MRVFQLPQSIAHALLIFMLGNLPASALCSLPYQISNGQPADATQLMANLNALAMCINGVAGGSQNSIQYKDTGGGLSGLAPLTNGQIAIGSTGNPPQVATITPGSGILINNSPGSITISAAGGATVLREFGAYAPPSAATFTLIDTAGQVSPSISDIANVGMLYSVPITSGSETYPGVYRPVPQSASWTITIRYKYMHSQASFPSFGLWIKDSSGKMVGQVPESGSINVKRLNSNVSFNSNAYSFFVYDGPQWSRVNFDGSNINFSISWDGQNWLKTYSEPAVGFLNGNLQWVGLGGLTNLNQTSVWQAGSTSGGLVTYWDASDTPVSGGSVQ